MSNNVDVKLIWKDVLNIIEPQITQIAFDVWIRTLMPITISNEEFIIIAPYENCKNTVNKKYKGLIEKILLELCPYVKGIKVITENDTNIDDSFSSLDDVTQEDKISLIEQNYLFNSRNDIFEEKYTFDNFVIGKSNQIAYAAAKAVAQNPGKQHNPLFIYGGVGLGKTHIMHAIGNEILKNKPNKKIVYVNTESFINDFIDSIQKTKNNDLNKQFRDKYRNVDVLMLDDIQFISGKVTTQEALFHTFNELYQSKRQIVFTSDRHPKELNNIDDRLISRFQSGLTVDISSPDLETRVAILRKKAYQNKFNVKDKCLMYIAEMISTNIRELEGALSKVKFYCELNKVEADNEEVVKQALKAEIDNKSGPISMELITACVSEYFNIDKSEIMSKKKTKNINEARQIAIYLISEMLTVPLSSIGEFFGGRDHSTIIHARDKISNYVDTNPIYNNYVKDIKNIVETKKK